MTPTWSDSEKSNRRRRPVRVDVIAPTFEGLGICGACELVLSSSGMDQPPTERGLDEMPADWQQQYKRLADWVYDLAGRYGQRIQIRVIDPHTPQGLLKCIWHWVRVYPTWLVEGEARIMGWDRGALEAHIQQAVEAKGV